MLSLREGFYEQEYPHMPKIFHPFCFRAEYYTYGFPAYELNDGEWMLGLQKQQALTLIQ
jgi:hypothetical protein